MHMRDLSSQELCDTNSLDRPLARKGGVAA